jgi:hypothetical protein
MTQDRAQSLLFWAARLRKRFVSGQHFTNADLHKVIWPKLPVSAWMGIHKDELELIADQMEDAGLLVPHFGPRGGEGWALV